MGVFEFDNFANGSKSVLDAIVMATEKGATSIIGKSRFRFSYVTELCSALLSCDLRIVAM